MKFVWSLYIIYCETDSHVKTKDYINEEINNKIMFNVWYKSTRFAASINTKYYVYIKTTNRDSS
jgi:hypothetical protein